jgi:AAA domain/UvrD-like helicase C-terminal domain/Nuclease-related domain
MAAIGAITTMAETIPVTLPPSSTAGEKRVFRILSKLPDDCLVYYEPVVRRRYPDFIVILQELGVLIVEVKDWRLAELASVTADRVVMSRRGVDTEALHPSKQARGYMHRLMDECRRHPQASILMQKDGPYANRYAFPFCHIAVLSNINRSQIEREAPELGRIFPTGATVTRDQLAEWDTLDAEALLARLKSCFDPWWAFPRLTPRQVDVLRAVIHPEIVIRSSETELTVLDLRQELNARAIGDGHRIAYGVAGSGKTVLLIARAKLLAEEPAKRILLLCYNRLLAEHLASSMDTHRHVKVMTFHGWGVRNGIDFRDGEDDGAFGERLLGTLKNGGRDRGQFDAVLIDEAQDWPCSWFQCAKLALREPDTGDLLIVGDGSQSLYRKRDFTWADAGIHALGRTINKKFDLDRNYRNTAEILRAARPFAAKLTHGAGGVAALPVDPETALRNGPEPLIVKLDDALSECHYAAALIETWLRGGIDIRGRRARIKPTDIAVLYPRRHPGATVQALCDRLEGFTRAVLPAGKQPTGSLKDEAVRILPIHSARGLQFRIVLLLWAGLLPSGFNNASDSTDRGLLYVALTRAEDVLVVLHSAGSPYVSELYQAVGAAPAE